MIRHGHLTALSAPVAAAIVRRLRTGRGVIVLPGRSGKVSVRDLVKYERQRRVMRTAIRRIRPWEARRKDPLWPIGSRPIGIRGKVTRDEIYGDL